MLVIVVAWRGYTWCSLELSGAVADLKFRGIDIINSYKTPSIWPDILSLIAIIAVLRLACFQVAVFKAGRKQQRKRKEKEESKSRGVAKNDAAIVEEDDSAAIDITEDDSIVFESAEDDDDSLELFDAISKGDSAGLVTTEDDSADDTRPLEF